MLYQLLCPESAVLPVWSVQKQICQQQWSTIAWHVFPRKEISLAFDFQRQPADGLGKKKPTSAIFPTSVCYFIQPVLQFRVGGKPRWCSSTGSLCGCCAGLKMARYSALNVTLCPLEPSSCPNMLFFGRLLHEPAQLCKHPGHCMVLPPLQWAAGLMRKGTQASEGMLEYCKGRKRKLLPSQERARVRRDQWPRQKQEAFQY